MSSRVTLVLALLVGVLLLPAHGLARPADDRTAHDPTTHDQLADDRIGGGHRPVPGAVVRPFDPPDVPWGAGHRGVDLAAAEGEAVRAALDGTVSYVGSINGVGWVTVAHGPLLDTTYGDVVPAVVTGQQVRAGQLLGHLAEDAAHLDWGARLEGDYVDPLLLLRRWRAHLRLPDAVPAGRPIPVG